MLIVPVVTRDNPGVNEEFKYRRPSLYFARHRVMASSILSASLLVFAGLATAKQCQNFTIPVDISARQGRFLEIPLQGNLDATTFSQLYTQNGANYTATLLQGYQTLQGSYNISAKYCIPDNGKPGSIIQVLSHGIGFDKT